MDWNADISETAKLRMKEMGEFSPTVNRGYREVKGWKYDDEGGAKVYLDSDDLREIAASCIEVADWLDKRAEESA